MSHLSYEHNEAAQSQQAQGPTNVPAMLQRVRAIVDTPPQEPEPPTPEPFVGHALAHNID